MLNSIKFETINIEHSKHFTCNRSCVVKISLHLYCGNGPMGKCRLWHLSAWLFDFVRYIMSFFVRYKRSLLHMNWLEKIFSSVFLNKFSLVILLTVFQYYIPLTLIGIRVTFCNIFEKKVAQDSQTLKWVNDALWELRNG